MGRRRAHGAAAGSSRALVSVSAGLDDLAGALPALRQPDVQLVRDLLVPLPGALSGEGHVADVRPSATFVGLALVVNAVL